MGEGTIFFCMAVAIGGIIAIVVYFHQQQKRVQDAYTLYHAALDQLRRNPLDANQRQYTLAVGRAYSNLTRDNRGVTVYDEMALMNDIGAATASAAYAQPAPPTQASHQERLARLDSLRASGAISDQEHQQKRRQILDEL